MKKKIISALVLSAVVVSSMTVGAYAAANVEPIKAFLSKDLKIKLDGSAWTPKDSSGKVIYPITYNNTTYLPVRAVGEALNVKIGFDGKTNTVLVGDDKPATPAIGTSRSNPAPIGTVVPFTVDDLMVGKVTGTVKVEEAIRGDQAWDKIKEANKFNHEPATGKEYVLVKMSFNLNTVAKSDANYELTPYNFKIVSSKGIKSDYASVTLDQEFRADLYAGASSSGWVAYEVSTDDENPVIAFGQKYDGTGGIWLALK